MKEAEKVYKEMVKDHKTQQTYLDSQENQINTLEKENKEVEEKLRKRETDLYKYRFKIKDLKKSKQVLTHRTYEMRSNLKPKDAKI
jgi:septal ring factor EnvC (AmiA/AmiB activator)